jgi:diadenosine tetraphosphatase ApaH/serine/threonine PP2A family protein phosphatase
LPHLLLLDEGFMSGALTAAGLRDAGCRVTIVAGAGGRGAYDGHNIAWSLAPRVESLDYLELIDRLVRQHAFDRVLPLTEPIQRRLWNAGVSWVPLLFPATERWQRALLDDKQRLAELVATLGVAIPAHRPLVDEASVRAAVEQLELPLVVKGTRGRGGSATHIVSTEQAAIHAFRALRARNVPSFAQRYVRGGTFLVGGIFHAGRALRLYAANKLAQHPRRIGPGARLRSVHNEELLNAARRVMSALAWSGIASLDFVLDHDGCYEFLEVNPRPWGSMAVAEQAGVDLYAPLAQLLAGEVPDAHLGFREGVDCAVLPLALLSREAWREPGALAAAVRSLRGEQGRIWQPTAQALHLAHRLLRVARNWPRRAAGSV